MVKLKSRLVSNFQFDNDITNTHQIRIQVLQKIVSLLQITRQQYEAFLLPNDFESQKTAGLTSLNFQATETCSATAYRNRRLTVLYEWLLLYPQLGTQLCSPNQEAGKMNGKEVPKYVAFSLYSWKLLEESGIRKLFPEQLTFSQRAV